MTPHLVLPITLTMTGAATLINIWIARRVGQVRVAHKVSVGDGGNEALARRMRAHANFAEYTPFFLILVGLIELARGSQLWLWGVGALYIAGRILHIFGMEGRTRLRMIGILVTLVVLLGLALFALAIPYLERGKPAGITYAAAAQSWSGGTKLS
jgi:uncharacterized membrane protein YecN with MAPEG domain